MYKVSFHYEYLFFSNGGVVFTEEVIDKKASQSDIAYQAEMLTTNGYGTIDRIEVHERIEIEETFEEDEL